MAETIISTEFSSEMQQAYINYSMSVIMSRAVPDIRDGLKPVQRRVLYAMNELGLNAEKPHRKSARIVGDAMGKYHPHGDSSIYEALVVLSQDFKKGMALVDGHGNFGSIEGDGAAAMRYTEARLKKFTQEVYLADLDKNVVDFVPNFDETEKEPEVLPVRVPNFLVNGAEGIAVGMTTSVPTHNLGEVIDAVKLCIDQPDVTVEELMKVMPGPDFPTGGIVTNKAELAQIYATGKGRIKLRGKAEIQYASKRSEKDRIVITEIPYTMVGANIGRFLSDVANLVESKKIPDISDILNQSSKDGIKIVLELRKGADAEKVLQGVLKKTKMEDTFGVNMLAIANGKPEVLGLKQILEHHIQFQEEVNTRKYRTLLERETKKKEIQEGLIQAVDCIDLIIEIIRGSQTIKKAKECLITGNTDSIRFQSKKSQERARKLCFTEAQATAILELRLSKLIGLEILTLQEEYQKTLNRITSYEKILSSRDALRKVIKSDLDKIKKAYAFPRRTKITNTKEAVFEERPVTEMDVVFAMNRFGYVKMMERSVFEKNAELIQEESKVLIPCKNLSKICIFTQEGLMHQLKMQDVPLCKGKDKGVPIENLCNYKMETENYLFIGAVEQIKGKQLLFVTAKGAIKRVDFSEFETIKRTILSTKLADNDKIIFLAPLDSNLIVLVTNQRRVLKFQSEEVTVLKKASVGVRGMKLEQNEEIQAVYCLNHDEKRTVLIGRKKVDLSKLPLKRRDGKPEKL
ncbi:DNA gyrase subunit A [Clostridiales bacterium CHKCI001]|nr:DNA gyrase subunit A [Clostridiales bacterium CHKCI001]